MWLCVEQTLSIVGGMYAGTWGEGGKDMFVAITSLYCLAGGSSSLSWFPFELVPCLQLRLIPFYSVHYHAQTQHCPSVSVSMQAWICIRYELVQAWIVHMVNPPPWLPPVAVVPFLLCVISPDPPPYPLHLPPSYILLLLLWIMTARPIDCTMLCVCTVVSNTVGAILASQHSSFPGELTPVG